MFTFLPVEHGVLDAQREAGGHTLTLRARQIRRKNGEVRALVALMVGNVPAHSDIMSVDKDGDRHQFANKLYGTKYTPGKLGQDIIAALPLAVFEQELMIWSRGLWPAYIGASSGGYIEGDPEPSAPPWAVPGLVLQGSTAIYAGAAGANKSTLARLVAQSLEHGVGHVIPIRGQEATIWVNAEEDPAEHARQLGNVNQALGLPRTADMYTLHARGMEIDDLTNRLDKAIQATGARHIFIDSLSRMARGMNLNENATATLLVDSLGSLGCSVNWIGHSGHENTYRLAGSKHFENAARVMVLVQSRISLQHTVSRELFRGVRARVYKANGALQTEPMYWGLEYHRQYGLMNAALSDPDDWPVLNCTAITGEQKQTECRRQTWDGVLPNGAIRCARHRHDDDDV